MTELAVGQIIKLSDGRQGVIRFVGRTSFSQGDWVGVELDDDTGKNDGSVQGERYFDCPLGHGMFVRPTTCTILADAPPPAPA
ncbi:dynactin ro-3, partial [Magnaporthiopsis poae ATCC 64411]